MPFLLKFHRLRGLECFEGSTMKKLVRPVVFNEDNRNILIEMSRIDTEIDKKQNFPTFRVKFYAFFVKVSQTSWIGMI